MIDLSCTSWSYDALAKSEEQTAKLALQDVQDFDGLQFLHALWLIVILQFIFVPCGYGVNVCKQWTMLLPNILSSAMFLSLKNKITNNEKGHLQPLRRQKQTLPSWLEVLVAHIVKDEVFKPLVMEFLMKRLVLTLHFSLVHPYPQTETLSY